MDSLPLPPQIPTNPAQVMAKIVYPQEIDTSEYPEIEDFSILEPEVILEERPGVLLITEKPLKQNGGTRQVMVNGKLMTLMPYQTINNQKIGKYSDPNLYLAFKIKIATNLMRRRLSCE